MSTPTRRRRRRWVSWTTAAALALLLAAGGWLAVRVAGTAAELQAARDLPGRIQTAIGERDLDAASAATEELVERSARAAGLSDDPVWRLAEAIPIAGPNLAAARVSAAQLHALSADVARPLLRVATELASAPAEPGSILDVAALAGAEPSLARAREVVDDAVAEVDSVARGDLVPPLAEAVDRLDEGLGELAPAVGAFADAAAVLPPLLGADGPRSIVLVMQNSAEVRTGGGITGTFAEIRTDGGRAGLGLQRDSSAFFVADDPVVELPAGTRDVYGDDVGRFVQNASMTPDFALTAEIVQEWWARSTGLTADAVLSVDPVVLEDLLGVIGEITLDGETVTAGSVQGDLLTDPYATLDDAGQNARFAALTREVFTRVTSAEVDPIDVAAALAPAAREGRISLWSAHPGEQEVIAHTELAGPEARRLAAGDDAFAVYVNDAAGTKMAAYLQTSFGAAAATCRDDGRAEVVVAATLANTAPAEAEDFSPYLTGGTMWGYTPGDLSMIVTVEAPAGAYFGGARRDGAPLSTSDVTTARASTSTVQVTLPPGASAALEFVFVLPEPGDAEPVLLHTPLLTPPTEAAVAACA